MYLYVNVHLSVVVLNYVEGQLYPTHLQSFTQN
jgi:hypothetical protein